ncbi:MAG: protein translocase subunit SecF, partial [Polyangiaceae bacterium]|nr:protein translocase subunit SecF [Polyangiaceae bacterium]
MQLFPIGKVYDFMGNRRIFAGLSLVLVITSIVLLFAPGPRLGTDFLGGTEVEVAFKKNVDVNDIRNAVMAGDFSRPDVIRVQDANNPHRYLIRVQEVSTISEELTREIEKRLCYSEDAAAQGCAHPSSEVKISPGGEKITIR